MNSAKKNIENILNTDRFMFRIGELSQMTGVSARQLRYWEKKGYIQSEAREDGQRARVYSFKSFVKVSLIKEFLDQGFTLPAAVDKMTEQGKRMSELHQLYHNAYHGLGFYEDQLWVNMGYFDDEKTKILLAHVGDDDDVHYRVMPEEEVAEKLEKIGPETLPGPPMP
ncbi:MerR family transcriptional regulator [Levilactobacillus bambusae]|uniref:MerR family transcriptional regulator n=1 Tax=Levilactobacillus bambusae TaxID=2024736 RepID=A0A2V1N182_9LACO|nr:MerR family transcriptional regulator [Levilactobacillus bambusae]PWG00070.1 MerR family transcriptional regulator [Levilactobacillus bambusae]